MLAALFANVVDAVVSYTVDKLDLAEAVKSWLRRDPVTLAFQKSLARTYSAFARQYPDYANSLFDQTFLTTKAVPELSKLLVRSQHPDPALLAQAWGESVGADAEFSKRSTKPASDFLLWLEAELKGEQALQPLFDSRALDKIETGVEKLTQEIQRGLDSALKSANEYQIQIGGNVTNSNIIIGDNNTVNQYFYSGDFVSLNEYYIPPDGVFQRVRVDEFVGRDWLTAKVDAFLNDPQRKSGAFLLIGDAGVGKTSFMAHLVKERRYLHLFAEQTSGQAMLQRAMQSLGSQLVTRYQIDPYKDRDTLNALSVFPDFLERILRLAASTLTEGEKIVIVCDALDEAGVFPDHYVFGLPKELPDGVYFILSQRPVNVKLPNFEPVIEKLEVQGEGNSQDIQSYLSAVAKRPEVTGQIRSKEYSEDFFIQTLKEKSQGVWMYLHYIIKEIESGTRAPLDLANLPTGLVGYYAEYWDAWRTGKRGKGEAAWDDLYTPLLTTLAAAQEAITIKALTQWAAVTVTPHEVTRLLTEHWRAFITEKEVGGKKAYAPYHLSFKDFITGRVDITKLPPTQTNLVKDLAAQTVDARKRIVYAFEKEFNGEWEKLVEQDYPRLHLSAHLVGAKVFETLRILLTEGDEKIKWAEAREKKEETYAGYLNDLTYVWDYAEREQNYALAIRCMLIENSIHSLAANIPPELLAELAKAGIWSYARCFSVIRQKSNPYDQEEALNLLAPDIPLLLLGEALTLAQEIKDGYYRASALADLAPYLKDEQKAQALAALYEIEDESARAHALSSVIPHLNDELKAQALATTLEIENPSLRADVLAKIIPFLVDELKAQALMKSLSATREIKSKLDRASALCALLPHLDGDLKAQVLQDALDTTSEIEDEYDYASTVSALLQHLEDELKSQLLQSAIDATFEIDDDETYATALIELLPNMNDELKSLTLQDLLATALIQEVEATRAHLLFKFVPYLSQELKIQALAAAREFNDEYARAFALSALAPYFNGELKSQVLQDALVATFEIHDESISAPFSNIAPHLNDGLKNQALVAAREIKDEKIRASVLSDLLPHLNIELKSQVLQDAVAAVRTIKDEYYRTCALLALAPYLNNELERQILVAAIRINNSTLSELLPYLNEELKKLMLAAARKIKDASDRAGALFTLAPYLDNELKSKVFQDVLNSAYEIKDKYDRARVLSKLIPHLSNELKAKALAAVLDVKYESSWGHAVALSNLTPYLNDELKPSALAAAREIKDEYARAHVLSALALYLNDELKTQALSIIREIKDEYARAFALSALALYLSDELKMQGLVVAREIKDEYARALTLSALSPYISDDVKAQALAAALEIKHESDLTRTMSALAPHLNDKIKMETLVAAREINDVIYRARVVSALLPYLNDELKMQALTIACEIKDEFRRASVLSNFAPHLNDELKPLVLATALEIKNESDRAHALSALIPYFYEEKVSILEEILYSDSLTVSVNKKLSMWKAVEFEGLEKHLTSYIKFASQEDRTNGLEVVGALTPALVHFRGPEIVPELFRSIQDTARWWP